MRASRRTFLALTAAGSAALAGCSTGGGTDTETETSMEEMTETDTETDTPTPTETATESGTGEVALSVADQETTDGSVTVPTVAIDGGGWLVVHPEADGGGPNGGVTLAERELSPGDYSDVELSLSTLQSGDQTVYAMLHYDDPADGEYTFPEDGDPPVTQDGDPVVKPFSVTYSGASPALSVTDQETDGTEVTVPEAVIDESGWLIIHPEADGGGPDGGVTYAERQLAAGKYGDVTLPLSEQLSESQTLYAMLHYDDPADGEYTFPEDGDPPVTQDGDPLVKPFELTVDGS